MKNLHKVLAAVATFAASNPNGFTFNLETMEAQRTGFAVARAETQDSFGESGLFKAVVFALANNVPCVGGWYDAESGLFYYDATEILTDKNEAKSRANDNGQIAFFDLDKCEEIRV